MSFYKTFKTAISDCLFMKSNTFYFIGITTKKIQFKCKKIKIQFKCYKILVKDLFLKKKFIYVFLSCDGQKGAEIFIKIHLEQYLLVLSIVSFSKLRKISITILKKNFIDVKISIFELIKCYIHQL